MPSESFAFVRIFSPRYSREDVLALLRERLPRLHERLPLRRAVLFGSYARGDFTAFSDIDVLVVYADPPRPQAFALVKKTLGILGLQPHVLSEGEYEALRHVWERMTEGGVELWPGRGEGHGG